MKIYEKIREKIETTPGLTQRGLAEKMGLNPAAVNRMLYGRRNILIDELPIIEHYLGMRLADDAARLRGMSDVPLEEYQGHDASFYMHVNDVQQMAGHSQGANAYGGPYAGSATAGASGAASHTAMNAGEVSGKIPVYGGSFQKQSVRLIPEAIVDFTLRHPKQLGARDAFALYVMEDDMEPRYALGEMIYVHRGRFPEMGRDCVLIGHDESVTVKRYIGQDKDFLDVVRLKPFEYYRLAKKEIKEICAVVGRG